jgi:beta-galactosidase
MPAWKTGSQDFNQGWIVRQPMGPFQPFLGGPTGVKEINLPHDALRDADRTPDAPSAGGSGYYPSGAWTYVKNFDAPAEWLGKWIAVQFDGVAANSLVYLNGALVTGRPYAYSRFVADLTQFLRYGQSNELRVEVRVHKDSRWYTGAGIYREVQLLVADSVHFVPDGLAIVTRELSSETAVVDISIDVKNHSALVATRTVQMRIVAPDGTELEIRNAPVTALAGETSTVRQRFLVADPLAWTAESPHLYSVELTALNDQQVSDTQAQVFGIRTVAVDPKRGLRINGQTVKLRGACIHSDNGPLGAVSLLAAEVRKITKLKEAGFNAVRISHNPASRALLDACDLVGMYVMNEAFDHWSVEKSEFDYARNFAQWWERDVESMVFGSRNHASVIMYSIGNEIPELGTPAGRVWNRKLADKCRALDSSRPVTNGVNTLLAIDVQELMAKAGGLNALMGDMADPSEGFSKIAVSESVSGAIEEVADALDLMGYNYAETRYELDLVEHPDRVVVGTETFASGIAANWDLVQKYSHVIGDFTWTGWDYLGEAGIGANAYEGQDEFSGGLGREYPFLIAYCGDIDITGFRRPASYYREIVFGLRTNPYLAVQKPHFAGVKLASNSPWAWPDLVSSWSWAGYEGKVLNIDVYSAGTEVELFLNGKSVGRSPVGEKKAFISSFQVPWESGGLEAVSYSGEVLLGRSVLESFTQPARLQVSVDRTQLSANGLDLAFLEVELVDQNGQLDFQAAATVTVTVSGAGVLAGLASAKPDPTEPFDGQTVTTFDGRALAVVRATGAGSLLVTVTAPGYPQQQLELAAS